jgi:hypothetical protein
MSKQIENLFTISKDGYERIVFSAYPVHLGRAR